MTADELELVEEKATAGTEDPKKFDIARLPNARLQRSGKLLRGLTTKADLDIIMETSGELTTDQIPVDWELLKLSLTTRSLGRIWSSKEILVHCYKAANQITRQR